MLHKRFEGESIRKKFMKARSPKSEINVRGSLAIKAHATWIKVLTNGQRHDIDQYSQKTSSTYHTGLIRPKDEETEILLNNIDQDWDITGLKQ